MEYVDKQFVDTFAKTEAIFSRMFPPFAENCEKSLHNFESLSRILLGSIRTHLPDCPIQFATSPGGALCVSVGNSVYIFSSTNGSFEKVHVFDFSVAGILFVSETLLACIVRGSVVFLSNVGEVVGSCLSEVTSFCLVVSNTQLLVGTTSGNVYILTTPSVTTQLLIKGGGFGSVCAIAWTESVQLAAIALETAILVVSLVRTAGPRLVCKLPISGAPGKLFWCRKGRLLVDDSSIWQLAGDDESLERVAGNDAILTGVVGEVVLTGTAAEISLAELSIDGRLSGSGSPHKLPGTPHALFVSNGRIFALSVRAIDLLVSVDVHELQIVCWSAMVRSLVHADRLADTFSLILGLKKATIPLFGNLNVFENLDFRQILDKYLKLFPKFGADVLQFLSIMCEWSALEAYSVKKVDLKALVELVVSGRVQNVPGELVSACLDMLTAENPPDIDSVQGFIVQTVLSQKDTIDINSAIRICSTLDLPIANVVVHVYVLGDFQFAFDYLRVGGGLNFFLFSCTHATGYPVWRSELVGRPNSDTQSMGEKVLAICMLPENAWKLKTLVGDPEFLNSIPFNFELFEYLWKLVPHTNWDGLDDIVVYGLKCAFECGEKMALYTRTVGKTNLQLVKLLVDRKSHLVGKFIGAMDGSSPKPAIDPNTVLEILSHLCVSESTAVVLAFLDRFPVENVVEFFKQTKPLLALIVLGERRRFDEMVPIMRNCDDVDTLTLITNKFGKYFNPADLVDFWATKNYQVLPNNVDLVKLLQRVTSSKIQSAVFKRIQEQNTLNIKAKHLASFDVGEQFSLLAKQNKKNRGITVTATICHACLDPLISSHPGKIQLYSCEHIVHSRCCDEIGGKCPVCLNV